MNVCSVLDCPSEVRSRGWCSMHYERWRRTGVVGDARPKRIIGVTPHERVLRKYEVVPETGCWAYVGKMGSHGYSKLTVNGRSVLGHRLAYEALVGPIPDGLQLDHLCRNTACVNPAHLEPVTQQENLRRAFAAKASAT